MGSGGDGGGGGGGGGGDGNCGCLQARLQLAEELYLPLPVELIERECGAQVNVFTMQSKVDCG